MSDWERFKEDTTEDIIRCIQNDKSVDEVFDSALCALIMRFRERLAKSTAKVCQNRGYNIDVAYEMVEIAFEKYGKSRKFQIEKCNTSDIDKCFELYMLQIIKNSLNDYYKNKNKLKNGQLYTGNEEIITSLPYIDVETLEQMGREMRTIHNVLQKLPHKELVVYLTYMRHEKDGVCLPRKLQKELRDYLGGVTQTTVRAYKKKAMDKIEEAKAVLKMIK